MGAILDFTELLKEPAGIVGAIIIIAVAYFFLKWVFSDPDNNKKN